MDELTPEQLKAILGTDYETVLADILRQKASAEDRQNQSNPIGQVGNGHVFFDPAGAIENVMNRRRAGKDSAAAQKSLDETLAKQNDGRMTYAKLLMNRGQQVPPGAPRSADSSIPGQTPLQPPVQGAPQMSPGAPPALANASQMSPQGLQGAGVPPEVQALLARLRGQ